MGESDLRKSNHVTYDERIKEARGAILRMLQWKFLLFTDVWLHKDFYSMVNIFIIHHLKFHMTCVDCIRRSYILNRVSIVRCCVMSSYVENWVRNLVSQFQCVAVFIEKMVFA